jgi:phage shock protein PspC (stress-responsive transcriptional regulator)
VTVQTQQYAAVPPITEIYGVFRAMWEQLSRREKLMKSGRVTGAIAGIGIGFGLGAVLAHISPVALPLATVGVTLLVSGYTKSKRAAGRKSQKTLKDEADPLDYSD